MVFALRRSLPCWILLFIIPLTTDGMEACRSKLVTLSRTASGLGASPCSRDQRRGFHVPKRWSGHWEIIRGHRFDRRHEMDGKNALGYKVTCTVTPREENNQWKLEALKDVDRNFHFLTQSADSFRNHSDDLNPMKSLHDGKLFLIHLRIS